ncbi:hypothetical protein [Sneathiella sp.]|uniref:hypothetical protein n=1 Tax=Sneathiella sp. TaxID=1964365 RepID=UPI002FE307FB
MALYMQIKNGAPAGLPLTRPAVIPYTDPGSGEVTTIRTNGLDDAALLALGGYARLDPAFALGVHEVYVPGGTLDAETGLATPATSTLSVEAVQAKAIARIRHIADDIRAQTADAGPFEIAAWPVKAERSRRYLAGVATEEDEAIIAAEATARGLGESITDLAELQQSKALMLATVVSVIDGTIKQAEDAVSTAADAAAVAAAVTSFTTALTSALEALQEGE